MQRILPDMEKKSRRKPQRFSAGYVEKISTLLKKLQNEPAPQPEMFMTGEVIRSLFPQLCELRRKGYKLKMLVGLLEEKGIRVSESALSGYMGRMSRQVEQSSAIPVRKETSQPENPALESQRQSVKNPVIRRVKRMIFGNRSL
jgi:hypothetical protein